MPMLLAMRSALHHFAGTLALLVLATGLLLASAAGANAHPTMHGNSGTISASVNPLPALNQADACAEPSCQSDQVSSCCHMAGVGCTSMQAICAAEPDFAYGTMAASAADLRSTPRLDGSVPPVAQRPPVLLGQDSAGVV